MNGKVSVVGVVEYVTTRSRTMNISENKAKAANEKCIDHQRKFRVAYDGNTVYT